MYYRGNIHNEVQEVCIISLVVGISCNASIIPHLKYLHNYDSITISIYGIKHVTDLIYSVNSHTCLLFIYIQHIHKYKK